MIIAIAAEIKKALLQGLFYFDYVVQVGVLIQLMGAVSVKIFVNYKFSLRHP